MTSLGRGERARSTKEGNASYICPLSRAQQSLHCTCACGVFQHCWRDTTFFFDAQRSKEIFPSPWARIKSLFQVASAGFQGSFHLPLPEVRDCTCSREAWALEAKVGCAHLMGVMGSPDAGSAGDEQLKSPDSKEPLENDKSSSGPQRAKQERQEKGQKLILLC